jgi:hypothetical protein
MKIIQKALMLPTTKSEREIGREVGERRSVP